MHFIIINNLSIIIFFFFGNLFHFKWDVVVLKQSHCLYFLTFILKEIVELFHIFTILFILGVIKSPTKNCLPTFKSKTCANNNWHNDVLILSSMMK